MQVPAPDLTQNLFLAKLTWHEIASIFIAYRMDNIQPEPLTQHQH